MPGTAEYQLKDGRAVVLRTAGPDDVPAIAALFTELSPESVRSRFNGACAPALLARLARIAPPGTVSIVAAAAGDPGHLAAEARYAPAGTGVAELALAVLDRYQGTGLGHLLLGELVKRASESGLMRLQAVVNLTNGPMLHLLEPYGWVLAAPTDLSVASLEISAAGGMPAWPADAPGQRILVEQRSWFDGDRVAALRSGGNVVRVCLGPRGSTGRGCPLVSSGVCRLAEEADVIVALLPREDADCAAVLDAHQRLWCRRLAT
ncbi:MAG TPA: GNAT family N-acetyltransferase [Streptosporangiaceae bacterium]|nr:GNAT family N-acetyltransferase [Streptosporangiaceae bacterium]